MTTCTCSSLFSLPDIRNYNLLAEKTNTNALANIIIYVHLVIQLPYSTISQTSFYFHFRLIITYLKRYFQRNTQNSQPMHRNRHNQSETSSPTRNRRYHIERNSQDQEEIIVPYWEESSSANFHIQEEVRLLKMKNMHYQQHMERMTLEYEDLKKTLEAMDQNQKDLIRRNSELSHRLSISSSKMQQMKSEIEIIKYENEDLKNDLKSASIREEDYKRKISKLREEEAILQTKVTNLEEENKIASLSLIEKTKTIEKFKAYEIKMSAMGNDIELEREQVKNLQELLSKMRSEESEKFRDLKQLKEEKREKERENKIYAEKLVEFENKHDELEEKIKKYEGLVEQLETQNRKLKEDRQEYQNKKNQVMVIDRVESVILTENATPKEPQSSSNPKIEAKGSKNEEKPLSESEEIEGPNYQHIIHELQLQINQLTNQNIRLKNEMKEMRNQELPQIDGRQSEKINDMKMIIEEKILVIEEYQIMISQKEERIEELTKKEEELSKGLSKITEENKKLQEKSEEDQAKRAQQLKRASNLDQKSLNQLQIEYNNELQALKRLIAFKTNQNARQSTPNAIEIERKVRREEQKKLDTLIREYQSLQKQLFNLQQQVIANKSSSAERDVITFRKDEEEKLLYLQAIKKWQLAYEELHAVYETKLASKDEEINLLNLKLMNNR